MFKLRPLSALGAVVSLLGGLFACSARADLAFTPLGDLPGGFAYSSASAISADGTTVVGKSSGELSGTSGYEAFRWTPEGGMQSVGSFAGATMSEARAVSADGSVVAGMSSTATGYPEGFRWTEEGGMASIGDIAGGMTNSAASGVSADGSVVVGSGYNADNRNEGLRWTAAGGATGIGFFATEAGAGTSSEVRGVSAGGGVLVGQARQANGYARAFRYTAAKGLVNLGVLAGGDTSAANAVSADGSVVVGYSFVENYGHEAFRWTAAGGLVGLGDLPGSSVYSEALAVSADGSVIVGSAQGAVYGDGAFVWDAENGMRSIRAILEAAGLAKGWQILAATGVSADGSKIVGYGTNKLGGTEAWLLDFDAPPPPPPPEPTAALVWSEDRPQTQPFYGNAALVLGYDNGVVLGDIATQNEVSGGTWGQVEYADGRILAASSATANTGTRTHDPRLAAILVTNVNAYDLDATAGFLWQVNGGGLQVIKAAVGALAVTGATGDRVYNPSSLAGGAVASTGLFTNAVQVVGDTVYFSSTVASPPGIYKLAADLADATPQPVYTATNLGVFDFEVVGNQIYFVDTYAGTVGRVKTDGTAPATLVTGASFPNSIEVDGDAIYWTELNSKLIRRAALDGTGATTLYELDNAPRGVAVVPLSLLDGPAPQALGIAGLPTRYVSAVNMPVNVTLRSTSGLPVTLSVVSGPATVSGTQVTFTGSGTVVLRAAQAGGTVGEVDYAAATQDVTVVAAPRQSQTITFPELPDRVYAGTALTFTPSATASSGLPVAFFVADGSAIAMRDSVTGVVTISGAGTVTLTAYQGGDASFAAAPMVSRTFTVTEGEVSVLEPQEIAFELPAVRFVGTTALKLSASASSELPVAYKLVSGPAKLVGDKLTLTGAGEVKVRATQAGNDVYEAASPVVRTVVAITPASATLKLSGLAQTYTGKARIVGVTTTPANLPVRLTYAGSATPPVKAGSYAISATFADPNYTGPAVTGTLVVKKAGQTLAFTPPAKIGYTAAPITLGAEATSGLPVAYTLVSGPAVLAGGQLTLTGLGEVVVRAAQPGNANYAAAPAVERTISVGASVGLVNLSKGRRFSQTAATTVKLAPAETLPFSFWAEVDAGSGDKVRAASAKLSPRPKLTLPAASTFAADVGAAPALGLGEDADDGWNFGHVGKEVFDNWGLATKAELDALFPAGTYVFAVQGKNVSFNLPADTYPAAPVLALAGGAWNKGVYRLPAGQALTIETSAYAGYGTHANDAIWLSLEDTETGEPVFDIARSAKLVPYYDAPVSAAKTLKRVVSAKDLTPGRRYRLSGGFLAVTKQSQPLPGATGLVSFETETGLVIQVVAP